MLLHKSVEHDGRVLREAGALADAGHEVTIVHLPRDGDLAGPDGVRLRSAVPAGLDPAPAAHALANPGARLDRDAVHGPSGPTRSMPTMSRHSPPAFWRRG